MSSILRSKIIDILNASVGQYCHGIDKDHISVSVFNGEVRISDLAIKQDCFIHHGLPFSVSAGRVGSLIVLIPWASLSSQPIEIFLSDLVLDVCDSDVDAEGLISKNLDARAAKAREESLAVDTSRRVAVLRARSSGISDQATAELGRMGALIAGAVKNLSCSLKNLTIRYTARDGSSFVFHIDSVDFMNVDENLKQAFLSVHSVTRKCCLVDGLSLLATTRALPSAPVLQPISAKLIMSFENGAEARLLVGDLSVCLDSDMVPVLADVAAAGRLRVAQSRCAAARPAVPIRGNTRAWWGYVTACVKTMIAPQTLKIKRMSRKLSLCLKDYCGVYIKVLVGDDIDDASLLSRLRAMEADLQPDLIFRFRDRCAAIVESKGLLARKSQAASPGGWFSWVSAAPKQSFLSEDEIQALSELSFSPDALVLQRDAAQPSAAAPNTSVGYTASFEFESFTLNFLDRGCPSFHAAVSSFSASVSYVGSELSASCVLHRLDVCESNPSKRGHHIASSSLQHSDGAHQLSLSIAASPSSTSITGNVSGIDINLDDTSLALLSHWLEQARVMSMHSTTSDPVASAHASSVSLKLVAMHIQRSPQIDVFISWQAPTIKLQAGGSTLCLFLGNLTLKSLPVTGSGLSPDVSPPLLHSTTPHFFPASAGSYPCPSEIYHRFYLTLIDFTLGLFDASDLATDPKRARSDESFQRIIAPSSAQLSLSLVRGEFADQHWPFAQVSANCDSVSFEICPRYCLAINAAILMTMKLLSQSELKAVSYSDIAEHDFSRAISSYIHVEEDDAGSTDTASVPAVLLLFVSSVRTVSVRIVGRDQSQSDCSLVFTSSKTSLVIHPDDVDAYMSVVQVTCLNNLLPENSPSRVILSINGGTSQAGSLLHFWFAEKGSSLWSVHTAIADKTISHTGPSLFLSLDCADAEFNADMFRYQGLIDLFSSNLDVFSVSIKEDLSRKMESLIAEVKSKMSKTGSTFTFEGNFSKLFAKLLTGSNSVSVLSAELNHSSVKLVFSEGSTIDFCVSSDAFKLHDCITSESVAPQTIIESSSSQSLQVHGSISGETVSVTAKLSTFQSKLFAPAVAAIWRLLFPPSVTSPDVRAVSTSAASPTRFLSISLVFEGAQILFCDHFSSGSGFRLTAPTMNLSCKVQGEGLTTVELLEGAEAFCIEAVVNDTVTQVMRSDGSVCLKLQPSRYDLCCPVKNLSLFVSDRLLDYAIPFVRDVLGSAVALLNAEEIVDRIIQQHVGQDFCITTGAKSLRLHLGDSSPSQYFIPLFESGDLSISEFSQVEAIDATSKMDVVNAMHDGKASRLIELETNVASVEARVSFQGKQFRVLSSSKSSSNVFSFGGTVVSAIEQSSYSGDLNFSAGFILLQIDERSFSLFIRVFANMFSAMSSAKTPCKTAQVSATPAAAYYCIGFNAAFAGLSVELCLNDTISGRYSSKMNVSGSLSQDSFKIVSKWEDTTVAFLQRIANGEQSTIQELLERTNFNFTFKSDFSSFEHSAMLSFSSPIVCNTSYTDIKRFYSTFEMFYASFKAGFKASRLSNSSPSPTVSAAATSQSKLNVCVQADCIQLVFVNDCPPFCAPLLQLQLSKLSLDTCISIVAREPQVSWLKSSMSIALNHCINEATSCDDLISAKKEIVFEEYSFSVSSQLLPNDGISESQVVADKSSHCQHIRFEASSLFEANISQACVMSLVTAFARMHRDWSLWMRCKVPSVSVADHDSASSPSIELTPLSRDLSAHRFVFMCMRNETNTVIAVSHRGMPPIVLPPQCDVSLDDSWTNLEFTLHANDRSKVCVVTHVSILMEVGGHWIHVQSEERTGQQFVVFRGNLQIFNHTSISVSMTTAGTPVPLVLEPRQATAARFRLSTFCVSMLGRTEFTFSMEKHSICLSFDESSANSFTSQLEGASSTVRILGNLFAGVMVIRILPLLSIESSLPMTVSVLLSHQPNGSDFCSTSVHPHDLIDVCSASLARDVWLATTSESSDSHHSPSFTPLFSSALSSCASPSLASSSVILQCASLRHILSISLRIDEYGVPVISIFVSFVIKNCTHLPLDASLTNQPADSLEISTCRTTCPPQHDGQPTVSVLGTDKPLFSVDHFQHLSLSLKVPGSSKNASSLSLAGFEDSVLWLACSVQSDGGSCDLALCFEPHTNQGTLITIRYRTLFYNHTQLPFSFAVDPALDVFTAVLPSCHAYLKEYTQPCQAVVRLHYQDGLHTQVSSLIPLVSPSNHALSLVIPTLSGAVEQTFYLRIFEDNGTVIASLCDSGDVQSSILVSNETHNLDAFVSLSPSFQDKRIVCSGSTVNVNTPDPSQSCSLRVTFRAAGSAPGSPSAECSIQVNDVGKHESVSFSGRTVHVYIEPRHGMRHVVIAENPPLSPLFIIGSLVPRISFELDVPGIGLSCIDAEGCELFYFRLEHVWFRWQAAEEEAVELKIVNMQVDGPLCCGPDVIISRVSRPSAAPVDGKTKPTLPVVHAVIVRSSSQWSREVARVDLLRSATICVQELRVDLHEAVIYKLLAFLQPFSSAASEIIALNSEVASAADEKIVLKRVQRQLSVTHAQLLFVRQLMIHSVSCLLSFSLASNSEQILADRRKFLKMGRSKLTKTLLDVVGIGGIREAKVNINSLRIENLFAPRQQLISVLKTFFQSQLKAGALSFLGSLDALGNPKHLLMGYASAVSDIFIEPATSAVLSPKDIVSSMRHGTTSLIHNVVGSSLGSIASVSDAFSRGISSVTGNDRVHEASKIRSAGEGLKHGAKSLGMGFLSGITGVVTKPMEGARGGGGGFSIGGLMKGMASGIVGVVAEPVKGMADMISDVGKGIDSSTARLHGHKSVERLRAARPPSRWLTMPYNDTAAVASTFVRLWQGSATPRPLVAVVFDLIGHSNWRYSVLALHRPGLRDFSLLNLSELQELCKAKKLSTAGNHRTLMDRLTLSQPEELLFGHLRLDYTLSSDRWHVPFGKENLGFTHADGSEVLLQGDSNHRKSVKCLSHADAVAVANFIAKAERNLPLSEQEETLCFRCKGHH